MTTVLEGRDLVRDYHLRRHVSPAKIVHAVKGVNFKLEKGKTLAIVGESGCGKSTLARILTLIDPPTSGELLIDGNKIDHRQGWPDAGDAPQGADRLPEPLWLAESAPEDRRRAAPSRCSSTPTCRPPSGATAPWRCCSRSASARALQPLSAHVLGRPAPAHRHRPRADAQSQPAGARRAGLGARSVGAGADPQSARRPAGRVRADLCLHQPRSVGRALHRRRGDGDVFRRGGGARQRATRCSPIPSTPIPGRCSPRRRAPMSRASAPASPARRRLSARLPFRCLSKEPSFQQALHVAATIHDTIDHHIRAHHAINDSDRVCSVPPGIAVMPTLISSFGT